MALNQQSIFGQESSSLGIGGGTGGGRGHTRADVDAMQQGQLLYRLTGESDFRDADVFYVTSFTTLNDSGVTGVAIIGYDVDSGTITVAISASGLEPNQVHIQHIHGFPDVRTQPRRPPRSTTTATASSSWRRASRPTDRSCSTSRSTMRTARATTTGTAMKAACRASRPRPTAISGSSRPISSRPAACPPSRRSTCARSLSTA